MALVLELAGRLLDVASVFSATRTVLAARGSEAVTDAEVVVRVAATLDAVVGVRPWVCDAQ